MCMSVVMCRTEQTVTNEKSIFEKPAKVNRELTRTTKNNTPGPTGTQISTGIPIPFHGFTSEVRRSGFLK
jgi:hypothetical protein